MGVFCEVYGENINNWVLEYVLENQWLDFAIGDMAKELGISKPKAYDVMKHFEAKGYVKKSRMVGKTQLYKLNKEDARVQLLIKAFMACLKLVVDEYSEPSPKKKVLAVKH
jgi:Mn-dependent DtxR family transcriptional regulator